MPRPTLLLLLLAPSALLSAAALAQERANVELAVRWAPRQGERTRFSIEESSTTREEVKRGAEVVESATSSTAEKIELVREVLAVSAGKPTRESLVFGRFAIRRGRDEDTSLEGRTVLIERGPSGSSASLSQEVRAGEPARAWLERWKARDETEAHALLPPGRVLPGARFALDVARAAVVLGYGAAAIDSGSSSAGGTLERVFARGGATWAEVSIKVELGLVALDKSAGELDKGGRFVLSDARELVPGRPDLRDRQKVSLTARAERHDAAGQKLDVFLALEASRDETRETLDTGGK